jgi:hypothetical protein
VEIVKAALTGERSAEPPGTVERLAGDGVVVAAGDERLIVEQLRVDGDYVAPARVLTPGLCLEADPGAPSAHPHRRVPSADAAGARRSD